MGAVIGGALLGPFGQALGIWAAQGRKSQQVRDYSTATGLDDLEVKLNSATTLLGRLHSETDWKYVRDDERPKRTNFFGITMPW